MTNAGSPPDLSSENKISLIEEAVKVIYDLRSSAPHQPMRIMCGVLQSLEISLIKVKEEWERTEVGKLEATIRQLKERDLELSAIIGHMADQLIGRVPIKPVESEKAKDAMLIDLQHRYNDLNERLKEAINHVGELVVVRNDLQKANAMYEMRIKEWQARNEQLVKDNADLRNKAVPNSDLIKANAKLTKEVADLKEKQMDMSPTCLTEATIKSLKEMIEVRDKRITDLQMQVEHLEGEVEPNEQIEKLRQANADLIETRRSLIEDRDRRHEAAQSECLKKEHAIEQLEMAKKELADRKVMIGDLKGKLAVANKEIDLLKEQLSPDVYGKLAEKDKRIHELLLAGEEMEKELAALQGEVNELSGQVSNLQNLVARPGLAVPFIRSIDKIAKERDEAQASNKALSSVGESMFQENEALRKQNKELQETVITLQNQNNDLVAAQTRDMQRMTDLVREVEQHNDYLQTAIVRDAERVGVRIKGLEYEKRRLEVELGAKHSDIKELHKIIEEFRTNNEDLHKLVDELKERNAELGELEEGHPPADIQARMIDTLQERNEKLFEENASLRQINRELADGNKRMESELKARDVELAKRGKRIEDLRTTAEQQGENIRKLESKIAVANAEAEQLEREAEQLASDVNTLERQLVKAQEFKQQLVEGITYAFNDEVSADRIAATLELLMRKDPTVRSQVTEDLNILRRRYTEKTDELEQRKQAAVDMIKKAAPGAWKVVGARPLHDNEDGGDNEEASPEKEESEES